MLPVRGHLISTWNSVSSSFMPRSRTCSEGAQGPRAAPEVVAGAARRKARIPGMHDARV